MKPAEIHDAFFQGKALLLVEDTLTQRVVAKCWEAHSKAKHVTLRAVGGRESVHALVNAARVTGRGTVFGLVDRDFAPDLGPDKGPVVRTERHEIENHLLDFEVLSSISKGVSPVAIRDAARSHAMLAQSWMAMRRALIEMKRAQPGFPSHPRIRDVPDLDAGAAWIKSLTFHKDTEQVMTKWSTSHLEKMFRQYNGEYGHDLSSDRWLHTFSGKETLLHVLGAVAWRHPIGTDEDLAFAIAERWLWTSTVPMFISALRDRIITECGL